MSQKQLKVGEGGNPVADKVKAILGNPDAGTAAQKAKVALAALDSAEEERKKLEAKKAKIAPRRSCCGCCSGSW
jgi:hypothetical protein